jgi:mannose/cellobiose epimerase-like protein (N-acyl-D-glucosamine 2-epimerase family)
MDDKIRFESLDFLKSHTRKILDFYDPVAYDPEGGFFQNFRDDGSVFDQYSRHLVSSTRFVFNYTEAYRRGYGDNYRKWAQHALDFVNTHHYNQSTGHYLWQLGPEPDSRAMAYGHAFVMMAASFGIRIGLRGARKMLDQAESILETYFLDERYGLYADERSPDLSVLSGYRGQNANMHLCEAFIAAYVATGDQGYRIRAERLAEMFTGDLAAKAEGLIWEHYTEDWQVDWNYNRDKPDDLFKPWGFQPGHQVEWSKLLLQLNDLNPNPSWVERARALFDRAMESGWDTTHGGLVYGFSPDGAFSNDDKYFWVHAEAFAAAYRLFATTGESEYLVWYNRIWDWSWQYLVDHTHGAWYRIRRRDGSAIDDLKSPMGKVDYHTLGACWDVMDTMTKT